MTYDLSLHQLRPLTLGEPSSLELPCDIPKIMTRRLPFLSVRSLACQWSPPTSSRLKGLSVAVGTVRSVVRVNPFLVAHHILYFVLFMVPVIRDSVWGQKVSAFVLTVESRFFSDSRKQLLLLPFPAPMLSHHQPIMLMNNHRTICVLNINPFSQQGVLTWRLLHYIVLY